MYLIEKYINMLLIVGYTPKLEDTANRRHGQLEVAMVQSAGSEFILQAE